jgi:hypothetical protein
MCDSRSRARRAGQVYRANGGSAAIAAGRFPQALMGFNPEAVSQTHYTLHRR